MGTESSEISSWYSLSDKHMFKQPIYEIIFQVSTILHVICNALTISLKALEAGYVKYKACYDFLIFKDNES